jgi:hypothetical protein
MYSRVLGRVSLAASSMAVTALLAIPAAQAQDTQPIEGGRITFDGTSAFITTLNGQGIQVEGLGRFGHHKEIASFNLCGGAIDLDTGVAQILQNGEVVFSETTTPSGSSTPTTTEVELFSLIIDTTGASPVLTALVSVNGSLQGRSAIADLTLPSLTFPLTPDKAILQFEGSGLALDASFASTLNTAFNLSGADALAGGTSIGTADITVLVPYTPKRHKK